MANYTSHAIMSELLFKKLNDKNKFKIKIDQDKMKLFSFGQDLTVLNKECFHDTHKINSKLFFLNTIKYINENNLQYDSDVMAYLYGHIAHYTLDVTIHQFVNNMVDDINKEAFLTPHTTLECELDKYLINKFSNNTKYLSISHLKSKDIRKMVNIVYANIYGYFNASNIYFKSTLFIGISNSFVNFIYQNKLLYNLVTGKKKYVNNFYFHNCLNKDNYLDQKYSKLLNESISKAERMIKYANKYLYEKEKDIYLNLVFNNAPYNGSNILNTESIFSEIPAFAEIKIH